MSWTYKFYSNDCYYNAQFNKSGVMEGIDVAQVKIEEAKDGGGTLTCPKESTNVVNPKSGASESKQLSQMTITLPDDVEVLKKLAANLINKARDSNIKTGYKVNFWDPTYSDTDKSVDDRFAMETGSYNKFLKLLEVKIKVQDKDYKLPGVDGNTGAASPDKPGQAAAAAAPSALEQYGPLLVLLTGVAVLGRLTLAGLRLAFPNSIGVLLGKDEKAQGGHQALGQMKAAEDGDIVEIEKYTIDYTAKAEQNLAKARMGGAIKRAVGPTVEKVISQMESILGKMDSPNPLLVAKAGGSKSVSVLEMAMRWVEAGITNKKIKEIDVGSMMAGTQYRGMFERRLKTVLSDAVASATITDLVDLAFSNPADDEGKRAAKQARKDMMDALETKAKDTGSLGKSARELLGEFRGQFKKDLEKIVAKDLTAIKGKLNTENVEIIYFIDEVHTIVGAGNSQEGGLDASNMLKPLMASGQVRFIGATTYKELKYVEKDGAFRRRWEIIEISEATTEELGLILRGGTFTTEDGRSVTVSMPMRTVYENFHGVKFTEAAIDEVIKLTYRGDPTNLDKSNRAVATGLLDLLGARKKHEMELAQSSGTPVNNEIGAAFVRQNYQELTIKEPIRKLRAQLKVLEAEKDWLLGSHTGDSWAFPNAADVEARARIVPIDLQYRNDTTYVADNGPEVRVSDYQDALQKKVTLLSEEVRRLRGVEKKKAEGPFGQDSEVVNEAGKPHVRKLLEELELLDAKLGAAKSGAGSNVDESAVQEKIANVDLKNNGSLSPQPNESIPDWIARLEKMKSEKENVLKIYEGEKGIRATLDTLYQKQIEYRRIQKSPTFVGDASLGVTSWILGAADVFGVSQKTKLVNLRAIPVENDLPAHLRIPSMETWQTPAQYLQVLNDIVALQDKAIKETNENWETLYKIEEQRLVEHDLKDHPLVEIYIIAKAQNPNTLVPEYVKQVARRNVHAQNPDVSQKIVTPVAPQPVVTPTPPAAPQTIDWEKLIAEARSHNGGDESRTWGLVTTMLSAGGKLETRDALVRLETLVADSTQGKKLKDPAIRQARILSSLALYNDALGDLTHTEIQDMLTRSVKVAVGEVDHAEFERKLGLQRNREADAMRAKLVEEARRRAIP